MRVAIIDYGMGNLASVSRALQNLGHQPFVAATPAVIDSDVSRVVLPGVGAFGEAMVRLRGDGWSRPIAQFVQTPSNRLDRKAVRELRSTAPPGDMSIISWNWLAIVL